ncbi:MAG: TonB-dependent receptor plug domain-containing protein, partial [Acinetobacter sp.]|nr:TonB-dependent receptor plug domain-containing protein [Acinetobacter sp.]
MYQYTSLKTFKAHPLMLAMAVLLPSFAYAESTTENTKLPTITVNAEKENAATTEGTKSYTAKSSNTSTKLNLSLRETPQSVKVITREYLDDTNINSFQELLKNVTGVTVNQWDERQYPTARGFDVDYYLFDGVPSTSDFHNAGDPDLSLYDRVELVKGANGLMTGAGNPAIAINMIRKHANSKELTGNVSTSLGSWNEWSSTADVSMPLNADGSVRGRVVVKHEQTDSFADHYNKDNNVVYGVIDADLTDSTYLSVGASYQNLERNGIKWGGLPAFYTDGTRTNFDRSKTVTSDWTYWNADTTSAFATFKQKLWNDISLNVNYDYRQLKGETALLYIWDLNGADKATNSASDLYPYTSESTFTQNNVDTSVSAPFTIAGLKQEVIAGFMYNQSKKTDAAYGNPLLDNYVIDFDEATNSRLLGSINNNNKMPSNKTTQTGAYVAGKFTLLEPLKLVTGVRLSNWKY